MKSQVQFALGAVFYFSGLGFSMPAYAVDSSTGSASVSIPCIDDSGKVVNASADEVCKAILPKCSTLKKDTEKKVRDLLTLKIWGYYKGKDADLNKSSIGADGAIKLEGTDMANPICSVVGQKLKGGSDAELTQQTIGDKKSCGARPNVVAAKSGKKFRLIYEQNGGAGSLWIAYMQGAYPWLIRKNAYDVLNELKPDLSNLDQVIKTAAMSKDIQDVVAKMKDFSKNLSQEAKNACNEPDSNLLDRCKSGAISVNDPAQRACTLVKAQLAANEGALPNMLIYEIMQNRVYKQYDSIFGQVLTFQNPTMKNLVDACSDTGGFLSTNRKKKLSKTASCFFTGEFCTTDDGTIRQAPASGVCASMEKSISIPSGSVSGGNKTKSKGFASVIEKLIRHDVCGQNSVGDDNVCDKACISSEPNKTPEGCS